jgi:SAM-dependent methyltransferase
MSFINYPSWVSYIARILELHKIKDTRLLDLACGTGVCLKLWWKRGYTIIGLDRSLDMLTVCRDRLAPLDDGRIHLINSDMRYFALAQPVPIVTCLYDSLNYLLSEDDLYSCFQHVHDSLEEHGIFIFDMNTIHCLRDEWGNSTLHRSDERVHSVWSNQFDPKTAVSSLDLMLTVTEDGSQQIIHERHQERGYALSCVKKLLSRAGFKFSLYRHLTFIPAQETDLRIMGVAQK